MAPLNPFAQPFNIQFDYHRGNIYHHYYYNDNYNYLFRPLQQYPLRVTTYNVYNQQAPNFFLHYYYYHHRTHDGSNNVVPSAGNGKSGAKQEDVQEEEEIKRGGSGAVKLGKARSRSRAHEIGLAQKHQPIEYELEFKEEVAVRDNLTTVMIKNIPNKLDKKKVMDLLDDHCLKINKELHESVHGDTAAADASEFDFLYLPIDFKTGCNYGYAFVNFTTPTAAVRLHRELHLKSWAYLGSRKICEVTCARIQGLAALLKHFSNSNFSCKTREYLPVHFTPSRNGFRAFTRQRCIGNYISRQK